jgi:hypothetical protein
MNQRVESLTMTAGMWPASLTALVEQAVSVLSEAEVEQHLVLVLEDPPSDASHAAAATEALRSLVHASTLERPALSVNLVIGGNAADRHRTLTFLGSQDGGFVRGATLDLGTAR